MRRATALACLLLAAASFPAEAHRLKLFVHVEGDRIAGYGFYIGGGRPRSAPLSISAADGAKLVDLKTDADGSFGWTPPASGHYRITLDGGDGHVANAEVDFGQLDSAPAQAVQKDAPVTASLPIEATDADRLAPAIAAAVDRAVARQITPLLEAYAQADGRVRFNDILGGLGWIVGMAGLWLAMRSRRKPPGSGHAR